MAEQGHGGRNPDKGLAGLGEQGQIQDGAGREVQELQPEGFQDREEEVREWWDKPHPHEDPDDGDAVGLPRRGSGKTRVATRAGASGMASDPATPRVAASRICSSPTQMLGNRAT